MAGTGQPTMACTLVRVRVRSKLPHSPTNLLRYFYMASRSDLDRLKSQLVGSGDPGSKS